jgi:hypothetical protein
MDFFSFYWHSVVCFLNKKFVSSYCQGKNVLALWKLIENFAFFMCLSCF